MRRTIARPMLAAAALIALAACITETAVRPTADGGWQPPYRGPRHALVTILEFSDFECPFCVKGDATAERIREDYGDKVKVVFRQFPLPMHPAARPAAEAALAAHDQGKFWEMHDLLFANQGGVTTETLQSFAAQIGLDCDRFTQALEKGSFGPRVDAEITDGKEVGVKGTPAFVINGVVLFGAQPYPEFRAAVEDAVARADAAMKAGVPLDGLEDYFTRVAKENKGKPAGTAAAAPAEGKAALQAKEPTPAAAAPIAEQYGLDNTGGRVEGHPKVPDRHEIPAGGSPAVGPDDAPVTIVVFSDFQCPYCALMSLILRQVRQDYPRKVRVVFKNFPLDFHEMARPAAEAALSAADQGKFWEMHDAIFETKGGRGLTRETLTDAARRAGLDMAKFETDLKGETHKAQIDRDLALGADLEVGGTPTVFVNGRKVVGAAKVEALKAIIDEELKRK